MRLATASKALIGKHVRVIQAFTTRDKDVFNNGDIVRVVGVWRRMLHVAADTDGEYRRHARRVPVGYFELAEHEPVTVKPERPPGPPKRTSVQGLLLISPNGFVSVGGKLLSRAFASFYEKTVRITLTVEE